MNRGVLVKLFERIQSFFERLKIYTTEVPPSPAVTDKLAKIMAEVLSILGTATKGIKYASKGGQISRTTFCDKLLLANSDQNYFLRRRRE